MKPNTELDAATRAAVVKMVRDGFAPELVVDFIYGLGYLNGGLDMAQIGTDHIVSETAAAMRHLQ